MSFSTGETRVVRARQLGINFTVVPKPKRKIDSIEITRGIFSMFRFNSRNTSVLLDALLQYHAKNDDGAEAGPEHDWSSHAVDSLLLIGQAYTKGMLPIKKYNSAKWQVNEGIVDAIL